jgi:HNH endonuclease
MRAYNFTTEDIAEACHAAADRLIADLPPSVGDRIKPNQRARRHGSETRMFEFHIRDRFQPDFLDKRHFGYMVIYDPVCRYHTWFRDNGYPCQLLVRFYANRQKVYDKGDAVISALWEEMLLAEKVLSDFVAHENKQMIGLFRPFEADGKSDLAEKIYRGFSELMPYWHPKYAAVIDTYGVSLTRDEVREIIAGRKKFQPSGPRSPVARCEHSRVIPAWLRQAVLKRDGHRCTKCGCETDLEVDHVHPVAKGGLTVEENLQVLCGLHNRSKGDRESVRYGRQ